MHLGVIYEEILHLTYFPLFVYLSLWENFDQPRCDDHNLIW